MYDAENRRFMAQDIVAGFQENPQTLNRYAYVINNPKSLTDSTGENLFGDILDGLKGIGDSLVDNLIIEPLKVGAKVWDYVAEMVTGKPSYVANSISKIQEKVEESRSENVNNEKWYYGGRMVGDVLSAAAGIVAMASGLTMMGEGLEVMFGGTAGGLTLAPKSGTISAIVGAVIDVAGAALVVEGAAVAGYGAVVTFKSMDNFQKNLQRFQAASEGSGAGGPPENGFKKPKSGSGKEKASDVPSWARNNPNGRPYQSENGKEFAKRMMDEQYGSGNWEKDPKRMTEYSQLKKWGDRGFE